MKSDNKVTRMNVFPVDDDGPLDTIYYTPASTFVYGLAQQVVKKWAKKFTMHGGIYSSQQWYGMANISMSRKTGYNGY